MSESHADSTGRPIRTTEEGAINPNDAVDNLQPPAAGNGVPPTADPKASHADTKGGDPTGRRKAVAGQIDSLKAFIQHCFKLRGRAAVLRKADAKRIAEGPPPDGDLPAMIADLMKADQLMAVPPQFLLAGSAHRDVRQIWPPLTTAFLHALRAHPATADVAPALESARLDRAFPESTFDRIVARDYAAPDSSIDGALNKPKARKLRQNTIYAASLWVVLNGICDLDQVVRYLYQSDWVSSLRRIRSDRERLRTFGRLNDPAQASLLCSAFTNELARLEREANDALQRESEAARSVQALSAQVGSLSGQCEAQSRQIADLNDRVRQLQSDHEAAMAHADDNLERLRAGISRRIESEMELLSEGLSALRRDPPRVHVMSDHAERVIQKLKSELEQLRSEDPQ